MRDAARLLSAMRWRHGERAGGPWRIETRTCSTPHLADRLQMQLHAQYSALVRNITLDRDPPEFGKRQCADVVMDDCTQELNRHMEFLMRAHGRVLVSGLGLGCVVRGLLQIADVDRIDVVELEPEIVAMVWPTLRDDPRVHLTMGNALEVEWTPGTSWDFAWHDIWCPRNEGLALLHCELIDRYSDRCQRQGAWAFPRPMKRRLRHAEWIDVIG